MFLAGPKFKNPPASKLASDLWPFDPGIIWCYGKTVVDGLIRSWTSRLRYLPGCIQDVYKRQAFTCMYPNASREDGLNLPISVRQMWSVWCFLRWSFSADEALLYIWGISRPECSWCFLLWIFFFWQERDWQSVCFYALCVPMAIIRSMCLWSVTAVRQKVLLTGYR